MEEAIYSPLFFPSSREKETFLASFVRIALAGESGTLTDEQDRVKPHIELIRKIPNFETLNAHMMWIAISAYSQLGDSTAEKRRHFADYAEIQSVIGGPYITKMIRNIFPYKKDRKGKEEDAQLMYEKITREVYLYLSVLVAID